MRNSVTPYATRAPPIYQPATGSNIAARFTKLAFVQDEWLAEAGKKSPAAKQALDEYRGLITSVSRELGVSK